MFRSRYNRGLSEVNLLIYTRVLLILTNINTLLCRPQKPYFPYFMISVSVTRPLHRSDNVTPFEISKVVFMCVGQIGDKWDRATIYLGVMLYLQESNSTGLSSWSLVRQTNPPLRTLTLIVSPSYPFPFIFGHFPHNLDRLRHPLIWRLSDPWETFWHLLVSMGRLSSDSVNRWQ